MPKEERLQRYREDSVDEVDTTDLENWTVRGLYRNLNGDKFTSRGTGPDDLNNIKQNLNLKLGKKIKTEQQAQERIEHRLHALYDEYSLRPRSDLAQNHDEDGQEDDENENL